MATLNLPLPTDRPASARRRSLLGLAGAGAGLWLATPRLALAQAATERRFVFIIQRGAADGLHTVAPVGDPAYTGLRAALALDAATATRLDDHFVLHPSLVETGKLYAQGQALFVHAVASAYRDRSHFDGQNVLETAGSLPYQVKDGWMNRLVGLLPRADKEAIAFAATVPMALRGSADVTSYAPSTLPQASDDLLLRVQQLYANDAQLHALWSAAMDAREMAAAEGTAGGGMRGGGGGAGGATMGRLAASFLVQARGPRIAMIETGGWDTHSGQNARLANQLRNLDALVAALRDGLGEAAWKQTVVLVATEFGRTAAPNGTGGTDHGTASVAWLLGGAVQGGRVIADWPGLAPAQLFEARDLRPTTSLDAVMAAAVGECFRLDPARVARSVFPQAAPALAGTQRLPGLLRTV